MLMGSGTVTAVIDRLADGGHVQRRPHHSDRRRVQVALTPRGRGVVRQARKHMERALAAASVGSSAGTPELGPLARALEAETERVLGRRP
jgi:DNA-binding MarR family transcriptional regulator